MDKHSRVIVIGASAGGVEALLRIAPRLVPELPAPILLVLHIGSHRSFLPDLLSARGPNRAVFARTGMVPVGGTIYVAPPDEHVLLEGGVLRLFRGPKEHHSRPAIDPLFRSAALDRGPRVVGVILTGMLDDGSAGLRAIKACGGITVVQDPDDSAESSMPRSALEAGAVDYVSRLDAMADLFNQLGRPDPQAPVVDAPEWLRVEHAVSLGKTGMRELATIGAPSGFTCPDCGGALFELREGRPPRFLCHTGHAFSLRTLADTHQQITETALWTSLRALQEKEAILRRMAQDRDTPEADALLAEAELLAVFTEQVRQVVRSAPADLPLVDADATSDDDPGAA